jgi:hypothetical protein
MIMNMDWLIIWLTLSGISQGGQMVDSLDQ